MAERLSVVVVALLLLLPLPGRAQQTLELCDSGTVELAAPASPSPFVVNLLGNVLRRPSGMVTEEDRVVVRVLATNPVAPLLSVHRTSAARRVGEVRIIGGGEVRTTDRSIQDVRTALRSPSCYIEAELGDFAAGLGEVEIRMLTGSGTEITRTVLGAFDFNVEPVYAGMFSLGPVVTKLDDPSFQIATNAAGETYIARSESGENRIVYALAYTPFVLGKRIAELPLTRDPRSWIRRLNPMFGVVLNDVRRNALIGGSLDLPFGFVAHAGWHVGRVSRIDPASGLAEGSVFAADGTIPVARTWDDDFFWAATIDTRVALKLLGLAGSTTIP